MKVFILICLLIIILLCSCLNKNDIVEEFTDCTDNIDCTDMLYYCNNGICKNIVSSNLHPDNFQDVLGNKYEKIYQSGIVTCEPSITADTEAICEYNDDNDSAGWSMWQDRYGWNNVFILDKVIKQIQLSGNTINDVDLIMISQSNGEAIYYDEIQINDDLSLYSYVEYLYDSFPNNMIMDENNKIVNFNYSTTFGYFDDDMDNIGVTATSGRSYNYVIIKLKDPQDIFKIAIHRGGGDDGSTYYQSAFDDIIVSFHKNKEFTCNDPYSCNYVENGNPDPNVCDDNYDICKVCTDKSAYNYQSSINSKDKNGNDIVYRDKNGNDIVYSVDDDGDFPLINDEEQCVYSDGNGSNCPYDERDVCNYCDKNYDQDGVEVPLVQNNVCNQDGYGNTCDSFNVCGLCQTTMDEKGYTCSVGAGDTYCLDSEKDDGCNYCPDDDEYNNSKGCDGVCNSNKVEDDCGVCDGDNFYITKSYTDQGKPCDCNGSLIDACGVCGGNVDNEEDCSLSNDKDNVSIILYFTEIDVNVWDITYLSLYPFWKVEMNGVILDTKSNNYPYYDYPYSSGLITSDDFSNGLTISTDYNDESLFEETGSSREYTPQTLVRFDGHIKDLSVNVYDGNGDKVEATIILQ